MFYLNNDFFILCFSFRFRDDYSNFISLNLGKNALFKEIRKAPVYDIIQADESLGINLKRTYGTFYFTKRSKLST